MRQLACALIFTFLIILLSAFSQTELLQVSCSYDQSGQSICFSSPVLATTNESCTAKYVIPKEDLNLTLTICLIDKGTVASQILKMTMFNDYNFNMFSLEVNEAYLKQYPTAGNAYSNSAKSLYLAMTEDFSNFTIDPNGIIQNVYEIIVGKKTQKRTIYFIFQRRFDLQISYVGPQITALNDRITMLQNRSGPCPSNCSSSSSQDCKDCTAKMQALDNKHTALQTKYKTLEGSIDSLTQKVNAVQSQSQTNHSNLQSKILNLTENLQATQQQIKTINSLITNMSQSIKKIETKVNAIGIIGQINGTDVINGIASLVSKINKQQLLLNDTRQDLNEVKSNMTKQFNNIRMQQDNRYGEIKKNITILQENVTTLALNVSTIKTDKHLMKINITNLEKRDVIFAENITSLNTGLQAVNTRVDSLNSSFQAVNIRVDGVDSSLLVIKQDHPVIIANIKSANDAVIQVQTNLNTHISLANSQFTKIKSDIDILKSTGESGGGSGGGSGGNISNADLKALQKKVNETQKQLQLLMINFSEFYSVNNFYNNTIKAENQKHFNIVQNGANIIIKYLKDKINYGYMHPIIIEPGKINRLRLIQRKTKARSVMYGIVSDNAFGMSDPQRQIDSRAYVAENGSEWQKSFNRANLKGTVTLDGTIVNIVVNLITLKLNIEHDNFVRQTIDIGPQIKKRKFYFVIIMYDKDDQVDIVPYD